MRANNSIRFQYNTSGKTCDLPSQHETEQNDMLLFVPFGSALVSAGTYLITLIAIYRNMSEPSRREALYVLKLSPQAPVVVYRCGLMSTVKETG